MRPFIAIFICLFPFISEGQIRILPDTSKIKISETFWATPGSCYLDSIEIKTDKIYLDPSNIKEIKTFKGADNAIFSGSKGAVLITRKNKRPLVTLADIKIQTSNKDTIPYKFIIDEILIEDTSGVRLEAAVIEKIDILRNASNKWDHGYDRTTSILITTKLKNKKNGLQKHGY